MKKYKTFGELLAYIKDNHQACANENLCFLLGRSDTYEYELFADAQAILTRVYPIEVLNAAVLGIKDTNYPYIVIELHIH